jgi:chemotaxis protein histidine kinase CheA
MAEEVYIKGKFDTKDAEKSAKKLKEDIKDTKVELDGVTDAADKATGGMVSGFKSGLQSVKGVIKGFKTLRGAIIATGLGALVVLIGSLAAAFTRSEEGQNKFAKLMGVIGSVTGVVMDRIANLGEAIIGAFENPKEALMSFVNLLKNQVVNRFTGLLELVPKLGKAVNLLFSGQFKEAGKVATDAVGKIVLGVENTTERLVGATKAAQGLIKEIQKESKAAAKIADQRAKAEKMQRDLIVQRAEAERDRAELMEKAIDKENFTLQERIAFTEQAAALEEEITNKEIAAAQLRLQAKIAENALGKSTKEDLEEEAQLKAELIQLETNKLNRQKETTAQIVGFKAEEQAAIDALEAEAEAKRKEREAQELKDAQELEKKKLEAKAKADAQAEAMEQATQDARKNIIAGSLAAIASLAQAFAGDSEKTQRRAFAIQKQVQIAQTLMSTYQAITDAMAAKGGDALLPFPLRLANSVIAGIAGFANVRKIATTKFNSTGVVGGSAPRPQAASGPSISLIGGTEQTQIGSLFNQSQEPQRAYVTQGDINSNASLDRHVTQNATLAG